MGVALVRFAIALIALSLSGVALAEEPTHLELRLIAESDLVQPGSEFAVGLKQKPMAGWHTYWLNPGDTGYAPIVEWDLPDGVTLEEARWPAPTRIPYADGVTFGFKEPSTIIYIFKAEKSISDGSKIILNAHIDDLVCADACEPALADLSILVTANSAASPPENHGRLERSFNALPLRIDFTGTLALRRRRLTASLPIGAIGAFAEDARMDGASAFSEISAADGGVDVSNIRRTKHSIEMDLGEAATAPAHARIVIAPAAGKAIEARFVPHAATAVNVPLLTSVFLAFVGGMILNLMPCVFPVLSIKLFALARANSNPEQARAEAAAYSAGVIASFLFLAFAIEIARALGASLGWGFQMQSPLVTGALGVIMLLIALNMSGLFEIGATAQAAAGLLGTRLSFEERPLISAFFTGTLAVVVSAPCTAPFMAAAVGAAVIQGGVSSLAIFLALGAGFALPFAALVTAVSFLPSIVRRLPKPGAWMVSLRRWLAAPMYATAAWLFWVFSRQTTFPFIACALIFVAALAFIDKPREMGSLAIRGVGLLALASLMVAPHLTAETTNAKQASAYETAPYSEEALRRAIEQEKPVFIDMTADWCVTCKVNELGALGDANVAAAINRYGVTVLVGDWTNRDARITQYLRSFGRTGVPMYVLYDNTGKPDLLPQLLSAESLAAKLKYAAEKE